jgi:membrane protein
MNNSIGELPRQGKTSVKTIVADFLKKIWFLLTETVSSFAGNNDLTAASSLAFSTTLALIPALFLLTILLGTFIGSSTKAVQNMQDLLTQLIPAYSQVILREVKVIASHKGTMGLLNLFVLFWSITPLVADLRVSLGKIFRKKPSRPFLLEKVFDAAIGMAFLVGLALVSIGGLVFKIMERIRPLQFLPGYLGEPAFFALVAGVVLALFFTFSSGARFRHLLIGALVTSVLWFAIRPAFHLFLTYNPGYGFAFGSFKSLFVVIIWIYISLALFLFGAEISAALGLGDTVHIKNLMEGRKSVPSGVVRKYVARYGKGSVIFKEGDSGNEMYSVLRGKVAILKGDREIVVIPQGKSFGELSFLLSAPRVATAMASEEVELVILNNENLNNLMNEFPEFVVEMLREMAARLRETNRMID